MSTSKKLEKYILTELPHKLLLELYKDSRISLQELGRRFNISNHTIFSVLNQLTREYKLIYTLELSERALGFSEGRIITIKFKETPEINYLKNRLQKDIFVQDAYLAEGDFNLLLYVVGTTSSMTNDFQEWLWNLRMELSEYKPILRVSTVNAYAIGFFPLRNELIKESTILSNTEKKVLSILNENSRMKLNEIVKASKTTQMKVIYTMEKLKEKGIIKRFTTLTNNTDKKIISAYGILLTPSKKHNTLLLNFSKELINEDLHEITNDYCLVASTNGSYDSFNICAFKSGETLQKRGPILIENLWTEENPRIKKVLLTDLIVGKWPFHLEEYEAYRKVVEKAKEMSKTF